MATTTRRTRKPADATEPAGTTAPATDAPAADAPATDPVSADTTSATANDTPTHPSPTGDTPAEAPVSGAPVSGAPISSADHLKVVMVAGVLGDHPEGASAATIADESGLRAAIVARALAAMEAAGAAVRKPANEDGTPGELWVRGEADLSGVSIVIEPTYHVCTCGHRHKVGTPGTRPTSTTPGHNGNGQTILGKGELRAIVLDFLRAHPGHEVSPTTISHEIGRSSGAIGNALTKLVVSGEALLINEAPARYSAAPLPPTPAAAVADNSPSAGK